MNRIKMLHRRHPAFALAFLTMALTAGSFVFAKGAAPNGICEAHRAQAASYRKWAKLYHPLSGQNASYRTAFQNYEALADAASSTYHNCDSKIAF